MNPGASFELARELQAPGGAPLADVFSFVSGLYFRGKVAYARAFGKSAGRPSAYVLTAGGGLVALDERVTRARLEGWQKVAIREDNPHFTAPLVRHATALLQESDAETHFVLLGSLASRKYVVPLREVFEDRLLAPCEFSGMGDMARGSLLLRCVREERELAYCAV